MQQLSPGGGWLYLILVLLAGVATEEEYDEKGWLIQPDDIKSVPGSDNSDDNDPEAEKLQALMRKPRPLGDFPSDEWAGNDNKKYNVTKDKSRSNMFRSGGGLKSRGHFTQRQKSPEPLEHKPHKEDAKGCGNPICVVLDRKVYRFRSLCAYSEHIAKENRKEQMNFIQKGDCYDIISGKERYGGATEKPWTPKEEDLGDCKDCSKQDECSEKITLNIDLKNVIKGESSAYGGDSYHDRDPMGRRWVGLPLEFDNICKAMKFFQTRENLNFKTQVIGIAFGAREDLLPTNSNSDKCLWTEWFDHDTPCNSDGDHEKHSEHFQRLEETATGPVRICGPANFGSQFQHEGGSEVTQVSTDVAIEGQARGKPDNNGTFKQVIKANNLEVKCVNADQTIDKLPSPFRFYSGESGKKSTCLDYKSRYCCKSNQMYRATPLEQLEALIPYRCPIGPMFSTFNISKTETETETEKDKLTVTVKVFPLVTENQKPAKIHCELKQKEKEVECTILDGGMTRTYNGKLRIEKDKKFTNKESYGGISIDRYTMDIAPANQRNPPPEADCKIKLDVSASDSKVVRTDIKHADDTFAGTKVKSLKNGRLRGTTRVQCKGIPEDSNVNVVSYDDGDVVSKPVANFESCGSRKTGGAPATGATGSAQIGLWSRVADLNQVMQPGFFTDSPPLASIFAECEWMDWINEEYPDKYRTKKEWELRVKHMKNKKMRKHVCGPVMEAAHYVDAVYTEPDNQKPWYELMNGSYEVYKLSPFHGYLCDDSNMKQPNYCQDMKVRYCCVKTLRAQWSEWRGWSKCTKTCGGGTRIRKKECMQSKFRDKGSDLYKAHYNKKCVGEESEAKKKLCSEQVERCNEEGCPVPFEWSGWSMWTACTVSCNKGKKTRARSCYPAQHGGAECPDKKKKKNRELYLEETDCSQVDCEIYKPTRWSDWSQCSATCGKGNQKRTRKCESVNTLKLVDKELCLDNIADPTRYYEQGQVCKMGDCAIDGNWGKWTEWERCTQDCIDHPSTSNTTQAYQARRRYCNNPLPAYSGKDCKKNPKYTWRSELKAEEMKAECCTPHLEKAGKCVDPDHIVPYCAENCIHSMWGEWSACSETCIEHPQRLGYSGSYNAEGATTLRQAKNIKLHPPCQPKHMPKQERMKTIIKRERFGGTCDILQMAKQSVKNADVLLEDRDCTICKEHCPFPVGSGENVENWPALKYERNQHCIGYCPMTCKWEPITYPHDCQKEQEEYFKEPNEKRNGQRCYPSEVIAAMADAGKWEAASKYHQALFQMMEQSKTKGEAALPEWWKHVPVFKEFTGELADGTPEHKVSKGLGLAWPKDREYIIKLTKKETQRMAEVPNLDGLFGGKACQRSSDQKKLTIRDEKDKKFDKKTMTNSIPREHTTNLGVCDLQICPVPDKGPSEPGNTEIPPCAMVSWAEWGEWGQCDLQCGDEGKRKRLRKCVNVCEMDEKKKVRKSEECRPFIDTVQNKTFTDTDWTRCEPCPALLNSEWSLWSHWKRVEPPDCGGCPTKCGEGMMTMARVRTCMANKSGEQKCKGIGQDKIDRQEQQIPKSPCTEDDGKTYGKTLESEDEDESSAYGEGGAAEGQGDSNGSQGGNEGVESASDIEMQQLLDKAVGDAAEQGGQETKYGDDNQEPID